jgi:hypothetical protein
LSFQTTALAVGCCEVIFRKIYTYRFSENCSEKQQKALVHDGGNSRTTSQPLVISHSEERSLSKSDCTLKGTFEG